MKWNWFAVAFFVEAIDFFKIDGSQTCRSRNISTTFCSAWQLPSSCDAQHGYGAIGTEHFPFLNSMRPSVNGTPLRYLGIATIQGKTFHFTRTISINKWTKRKEKKNNNGAYQRTPNHDKFVSVLQLYSLAYNDSMWCKCSWLHSMASPNYYHPIGRSAVARWNCHNRLQSRSPLTTPTILSWTAFRPWNAFAFGQNYFCRLNIAHRTPTQINEWTNEWIKCRTTQQKIEREWTSNENELEYKKLHPHYNLLCTMSARTENSAQKQKQQLRKENEPTN